MSVTSPTRKYPRIFLLGSIAFFAGSIALAWPKGEPPSSPVGQASVQSQREQAIDAAKARGEKTYTYRSSFNPNNPGSQ